MDNSQVLAPEKSRYRTPGYSRNGLLYLHWVDGDLIDFELPVVVKI